MDLFLFQLAVIFIPGIVWERLDAEYAAKETLIKFFSRRSRNIL